MTVATIAAEAANRRQATARISRWSGLIRLCIPRNDEDSRQDMRNATPSGSLAARVDDRIRRAGDHGPAYLAVLAAPARRLRPGWAAQRWPSGSSGRRTPIPRQY